MNDPTSEKTIEKELVKRIKQAGGHAFKLPSTFDRGLPDRMCLLPGAVLVFVECKSTGKRPTKYQQRRHDTFRKLGFRVEVIDSLEGVAKLMDSLC